MATVSEKISADPVHLENQGNGIASPAESSDAENTRAAKDALTSVDKATERKLLRKLDLRIVPMVMWMYVNRDSASRIVLTGEIGT